MPIVFCSKKGPIFNSRQHSNFKLGLSRNNMNGPEGPSRCCQGGCDDLNNTQAAMERLGMEETPGCDARTTPGEVKVNSKRFGRGAVQTG